MFGKRRKALEREIAGLRRVMAAERSDKDAQTRRVLHLLEQLGEAGIVEKTFITEAVQE